MNSYYFTYGTDPDFPFCGGYTKIFANNMEEAVEFDHQVDLFVAKYDAFWKKCIMVLADN